MAGWLSFALLGGVAFAAQSKQSSGSRAPKNAPTVTAQLNRLTVAPRTLDYGAVASGEQKSLGLTLKSTGFLATTLQRVEFLLGASGSSAAFTLTLDGNTYAGAAGDIGYNFSPSLTLAPGQEISGTLTFQPTEQQFDAFRLVLRSNDDPAEIAVSGLGGHSGDPYLHVVIDGPQFLVDYDGNGSEGVALDGSGSHTHEPGHSLAAYEWTIGGAVVSTSTTLSTTLAVPQTEITLTITDDNVPPRSLSGHTDVRVVPPNNVPGVLAYYYDASGSGAAALLDALPPQADFVEQRSSLALTGAGQVGGSPFDSNVMVRLVGRLQIQAPIVATLSATGGSEQRLFLDGAPVSGPVSLAAGPHAVEARFAVDALADLPLEVLLAAGGPPSSIAAELLSHDETGVVPVIHAMTQVGGIAGGTPITIDGFGFFPAATVLVHWGDLTLGPADFSTASPTKLEFLSPPGGGAVAVSVENGNGTSNVRTFLYQIQGPVPVQFRRDLTLIVPEPTAGVWAPDGKLYVASRDGRITALEFDENYELVSQTIYAGVSALSNHDTLGLAINPYDPPSPVRLYVGHGKHFVNGGASPSGFSPYTGQISVLTGPNFDAPVAVVTGLPVSNHDHAINGLVFDHNGDLLISVGSATNAGVKALNSGDLPESPLSAAILKAKLSKPGFNGAIHYVTTAGGIPDDDQRDGEQVDVASGVDVAVQASGLRNAYGIVFTTTGRLYATDNGPNLGFGPASTGATTQSSDPYDDDELDLIEWGNYYGSPNRSRGRADARQNVYYAGLHGPASIADTLTQMTAWAPPSSDGIDEYRADTFEGQIRGNLIVQEYQNKLRRVNLKPDGRSVYGQNQIDPNTQALGCVTGPGGAIIALDFEHSEVEVLEADDLSPLELVVHDIFPWRAPADGGAPFVIAGRGFGTLGTTSVTIGGHPAVLTDVSWGRIRGIVPQELTPSTGLVDVVVTVGDESDTLTQAFRYLLGPGNEPGHWDALTGPSTPIGEVAAGVIDGKMIVVGEGSSATFAYDLVNRQWLTNRASRPFVGHHHAAEVLGGKLYLIGGISGGSEGKVQIFDPVANTWTTGTSMPWGGGSVSTALIGGKIYAAGGIVGTNPQFTVNNCAVYDPLLDSWTTLAQMPDNGRNHCAAGTDGTKLYVFGGRRGGNFVSDGYDSLMIYTPATDSWTWSGESGSTLAPLPEARGGMGKAVYLRGEFYVFGGETLDDPDANANGVYDRVDVYDPLANTWRREAPMPNPRHGIFPVLFQGYVFVAGGGTHSANSQSTLFDAFTRQ